ncbi:MAG: hypothetical protein HW407_1772, partial [Bacteroidetes bacterium]|nr:hypothetical protein [Bacteroidota bacterium]
TGQSSSMNYDNSVSRHKHIIDSRLMWEAEEDPL